MSIPGAILFERSVRVRFSHCAPAGIVFFPQYLTLTNALVEDWFNEGLGIDYAAMIGMRRIGLPIVKLECEFVRPSRMGESLSMRLSLDALGRRAGAGGGGARRRGGGGGGRGGRGGRGAGAGAPAGAPARARAGAPAARRPTAER